MTILLGTEMPEFSIVIPTRARSDTLRYSLQSVLAEVSADIEVIVHESGDDAETSAVVEEVNDGRIRFYKTITPIRMSENWERALRQARGEYVFFLGDDDALMPNTCALASAILHDHATDILSWHPAEYCWPSYYDPSRQSWLFALFGTQLRCMKKDSRTTLHLAYRFRRTYSDLPMIYNSFVRRQFIGRILCSRDRYFVGSQPDTASGIMNLAHSDTYLRCNRPLSIAGLSHHSTGRRLFSGDPILQADAIAAAFGEMVHHSTMVPTNNFELSMGNEYLIIKDALFPIEDPQLDYNEMLRQALYNINVFPAQYDSTFEECRMVAQKNSLRFDEYDLAPARRALSASTRRSPTRRELSAGTFWLEADCAPLGVSNAFDAARLLANELPVFDTSPAELSIEAPQINRISVRNLPTKLDFSSHGNGALILGTGWGGHEDWGVWSLGKSSELRLSFEGGETATVKFELTGLVFMPPRTVRIRFACGSQVYFDNISEVSGPRTFEVSPIKISGQKHSLVRVVIDINRSKAPVDAGLSSDDRLLGFGLQSIAITSVS